MEVYQEVIQEIPDKLVHKIMEVYREVILKDLDKQGKIKTVLYSYSFNRLRAILSLIAQWSIFSQNQDI